jgi:hypothetical protein
MKWWRSVVEAWKGKPFGFVLFSTLLLVICITVSGKSLLQASQGYSDHMEVSFPNHAQAQHARNVAVVAARQDPDVRAAFLKARQTGAREDLARARALLARTERAIFRRIAHVRASGKGWGQIAHYYGVHPGVLGLGHSKAKGHYGFERSIPERRPKQTAEAKTRGSKGDRAKENGKGRAAGNGNSNGHGHGNGKGHGGGNGHGKGNK